ncbi:MAG: hypothetical protein B6U89_01885 [Desulfurococcales archaeon ex4484_58]|nr:MAG: hypothetical protein B6U89_01885 [Desulfurococcales archaeon ex4484_58]
MKAIVKTRIYKPQIVEDDVLRLIVYRIEDEKWEARDFRKSPNLIDKMLAYATNVVTLNTGSGFKNGYVYVEVETPGLRVFKGEGRLSSVDTILYPNPQPLNKVVLLRRVNEELKPVHELRVKSEYWIYDTVIELKKNIEYDALLIVTSEDARIIFRDELKLPVFRSVEKRRRRKKRRARRKRKKKTKTTKKKKTRKKKSSRKRRKRRGRKK